MSKRAEQVERWEKAIEPSRDAATRQPDRSEDWSGEAGVYLVVLRSLKVADKKMTAQRVRYTSDPLTTNESAAGVHRHVEAFGKVFTVFPTISTPYSFYGIEGLVVPKPADLSIEDLGANFVPLKVYPGKMVELLFKAPGFSFTDPNAQSTEGGSV